MKRSILLAVAAAFLTLSTSAQSKSNDAISTQIKALKSERTISLTYDQNSNVSKLMVVTENFTDREAGNAGVQAMNFALGFMYSGQSLAKVPDSMILTFWVLTKKPQFAANHSLFITGAHLDLGAARYVSRLRDNMEYLNFDISRENLAKIARDSRGKFRLGEGEFTFTRDHLEAISDLLIISDPTQ